MDGLSVLKIERPILDYSNKNILLPKEVFDKVTSYKYLQVLVSNKRSGYSKSYYYYILSFLKENKLIINDSISFTLALPVLVNEKGMFFIDEIMFVDPIDKILIIKRSAPLKCDQCPLIAECEFSLKKISRYVNSKLKGETYCEKWTFLINNIVKNIARKLNQSPLLVT